MERLSLPWCRMNLKMCWKVDREQMIGTIPDDPSAIEADNARWYALLATDEAQSVLEKLAAEALAEHRTGCTKPITSLISTSVDHEVCDARF